MICGRCTVSILKCCFVSVPQGTAGPEANRGDAATAAAKAAREPCASDAIGPIDRLVADLLYKEPLQQVLKWFELTALQKVCCGNISMVAELLYKEPLQQVRAQLCFS